MLKNVRSMENKILFQINKFSLLMEKGNPGQIIDIKAALDRFTENGAGKSPCRQGDRERWTERERAKRRGTQGGGRKRDYESMGLG